MDIDILKQILEKSWSRETSYYNDFNPQIPSLGQCAVTALVVQDYLDGKIIWAEAVESSTKKVSHYFNLIAGQEVDLTRSQFSKNTIIPKGVKHSKDFNTTREYLLSNQNTKRRYEILSKNVKRWIS